MRTPLFVTGMFRSGTTLLARMLDAHPEVSIASDPYRPFFNDFRDFLREKHGLCRELPRQAPLGSYFCDDEELELMKMIQTSDFSGEISAERLRQLIPIMGDRASGFSPLIAQKMDRLRGGTYKEVYESMLDLVQECYGKSEAKVVGTKEVWCTEFTSVLSRTFPHMKFILMIRDPRAVFASNNVKPTKYPWLFLARQWRKLAIFSWVFSTASETKDRVLILKYEDLISDPEEVGGRISAFLGIPFRETMIDGRGFRDGTGAPWLQNSSYGTGDTISTAFADKWRETLGEDEIRLIECLCYPEMEFFGYEVVFEDSKTMTPKDVLNPRVIPEHQLADWIRPYSDSRFVANVLEMLKEFWRRQVLLAPEKEAVELDPRVIETLFLDRRYYQALRKTLESTIPVPSQSS